jgi:fatty-acyl-CoA synthase
MSVTSFVRALAQRGNPYWGELRAELELLPELLRSAVPLYLQTLLLANPTLLTLLQRNAKAEPHGLALELDAQRLTWSELERLTSRVAHVLAAAGVRAGDVVVLLGHNSPRYVGLLLGVTRLGATTALINYNLRGAPLVHALQASRARVLLVEDSLAELLPTPPLPDTVVLRYGGPCDELDVRLARATAAPYTPVAVDRNDDFVYIYTSGTTGLPKPCRVSHARALIVGTVLGQVLFDFQPGDKLYSPLPLYHSSALLIGVAAAIAHRTPTALRESFSASSFLADVRRYNATAMLYIGEMCRYLLATPPSALDRQHRLRVAVGNGLRPEIWARFRDRFGLAKLHEFYSATEAPGMLLNLSGVEGSVGRLPLDGLGMYRLARFDVDREELVRNAQGFCIPVDADEPGELLIKIVDFRLLSGLAYRGYTDPQATSAKVVTEVFTRGDRYFRSGDLLRRDALGFYSFVDRIGDTFRCKGENVSTSEVATVLDQAPGVAEVTVLGIRIPGLDGQFGLAVVVPAGEFDPRALHRTAQELPSYAQPRFVRLLAELKTTSTHKHQKAQLQREGVDPSAVAEPLFVRTETTYEPLTPARYAAILDGTLRL